MSDTTTLTDRLAEAAAVAVRARTGAIEAGGAGNLNSIVVELELSNGDVIDRTAHLSWRDVIRNARRGDR
jgi:hypothetical protein